MHNYILVHRFLLEHTCDVISAPIEIIIIISDTAFVKIKINIIPLMQKITNSFLRFYGQRQNINANAFVCITNFVTDSHNKMESF